MKPTFTIWPHNLPQSTGPDRGPTYATPICIHGLESVLLVRLTGRTMPAGVPVFWWCMWRPAIPRRGPRWNSGRYVEHMGAWHEKYDGCDRMGSIRGYGLTREAAVLAWRLGYRRGHEWTGYGPWARILIESREWWDAYYGPEGE